MFSLKKTNVNAISLHISKIFRQYGVNSIPKFKWRSGRTSSSRFAGILLGIGGSLAAGVATIAYAVGERKEDDPGVTFDINPKCSGSKEDERECQLKAAVRKSTLELEQVKEEIGSPGLVCAVSIDGKLVWTLGLGFADVENGVKCHDGTMMRIASISKALTSIAIGKLLQEGKVDLNAPVQRYVDYFPEKEYNGEKVAITMKQLMSHTSGVRHYEKELREDEAKVNKKEADVSEGDREVTRKDDKRLLKKSNESEAGEKIGKEGDIQRSEDKSRTNEFINKEYYIREHFNTVKEAIGIFKDDPLLKRPGSDFLYTTHGWTLLSACIEGASGKDYVTFMKEMCYELGLDQTIVELNDPIVYNRSRYYIRDSKGKLKNTPYVDNSYKWAGGGFLSTVGDLVKIGNIMLFSSQRDCSALRKKGYLRKDIVDLFWTPEPVTVGKASRKRKDSSFGLGWQLLSNASSYGCCRETKFAAMHSGAAVGASSILLIVPKIAKEEGCDAVNATDTKDASEKEKVDENGQQGNKNQVGQTSGFVLKDVRGSKDELRPQGIVVAIMANMQEVSLSDTAFKIAENFTFDL